MMRGDLEYYVGRKVSNEEYEQAIEWQEDHPGVNLSEYVEAMIEIGAL
jgi:hypothetical protein